MENFESATSDFTPQTSTDATSVKDAWIFQVPSQDKLEEDAKQTNQLIKAEEYISQPFPKDDIDPYEWSHTLATLDVCALPPMTKFCDEDGYEVVLVRVVSIVHSEPKDSSNPEVPLILHKERKATSLEDLASSKSKCSLFLIPLAMIT